MDVDLDCPKRDQTIGNGLTRFIPTVHVNERVYPADQVPASNQRPDGTNLLLAASPDFLQVMKVLFDAPTIGDCFEYLSSI